MNTKIGINLLPYSPNQQGGAEVYIRNLIWNLADDAFQQNTFVLFVTPRSKGKYLPESSNFKEVVLPGWLDKSRILRIIGEQFILPVFTMKQGIDVLFSNYVGSFLSPKKQVINIHDMLYKRLPHMIEKAKLLYWQIMIPVSIKKSQCVMTVSHSSAKDISFYFPSSKEKLFVTVEGVSRDLLCWQSVASSVAKAEFNLPESYILSSATFGKHKNILTLVKAFAQISEHYPNIKLVLTGGANTGDAAKERAKLKEYIVSRNLTEAVLFTGYVPEKMLVSLYKGATVYVIPSFYEGFGLSVIEAQYFGVPVICSDAEALLEIGGDAVLSVPALSEDDFANAISFLLDNDEERVRLREVGFENVKRYSWHQAALDFVRICESLQGGND